MDDYATAIAEMFERSIAEARGALARSREVPEARRIAALLVETIAGYAAGLTTRELARTVNAWYGASAAALVHAAAPEPRTRRVRTRDEGLDSPVAPNVRDDFVDMLRARLAETAAELRAMIEVVAARLPGDRSRAATAMFGELARTARYDDRLAREIAIGWRCACAAIEHTPMPDVDGSPRARDLWRIWSELVGNPRASETRQGVQRDGFIALVG